MNLDNLIDELIIYGSAMVLVTASGEFTLVKGWREHNQKPAEADNGGSSGGQSDDEGNG